MISSIKSLFARQVVDLRWGIRNVPFADHGSCEIFLQEIERCKKVSAGPAFIVSLIQLLDAVKL